MSTGKRRNGSRLLLAGVVAVILGTGTGMGTGTPALAAADDSSQNAEAERQRRYTELRKRGNKSVKEGRAAEAIEAWLEAYKLNPSHDLACAIGRTELLGRASAVEGARWLTRCASLAPIPDPNAKDAALELAAQQEEIKLRDLARARVSVLRVLTDNGAEVRVDGRPVGKAPLEEEVFVKPGVYWVVVSLGSRSRSVEVRLSPGETRTVDLALPPEPRPPAPLGRVLLISGIGAGAVGLGVGIGFGVAAIHHHGQAKQASDALESEEVVYPCNMQLRSECVALVNESKQANRFTAASVAGLSVAVAGGVMTVLGIRRAKSEASAPTVQGAFVGAPGGGAFVVKGQF